ASTPAARSVRSSGRGRPTPPPTRSRKSPACVPFQTRTPLIATRPRLSKVGRRSDSVATLRVRDVWWHDLSHAHEGKHLPCTRLRSADGRTAGERRARGLGGEREGRVRPRVDARIARARPGGDAERPAPSAQVRGGRRPRRT